MEKDSSLITRHKLAQFRDNCPIGSRYRVTFLKGYGMRKGEETPTSLVVTVKAKYEFLADTDEGTILWFDLYRAKRIS